MRRIIAGPERAEGAPDLDDLAIDREDGTHHAEIDREEHADRDQRDLRCLEDTEPEDEQRHPGQRGYRAQRLHGRIEQPARQRPIAGNRAEQRAGDHSEREAKADTPQRRGDVTDQLAGAGEVSDGDKDARGRRHQPAVGPAGPHHELPAERERERQQHTQHRPRVTRDARGRGGALGRFRGSLQGRRVGDHGHSKRVL
ncbi:hypothetical protein ACVIQW_007109 [Bradyrhizobium diazoefficiens]